MMLARRRLWRVLVVAAALGGSGTRGLCFMPGTAAGPFAAHDCCKSGWTTAPPPCCMEGRTDRATAIRIDRQAVPAVSAVPAAFLRGEVSLRLNEPPSFAPSSFHSPPITLVLRV
ncbi:MAG TPA: hypothetical protein VIK51_25410 [Vicinamibacteria bacterium]